MAGAGKSTRTHYADERPALRAVAPDERRSPSWPSWPDGCSIERESVRGHGALIRSQTLYQLRFELDTEPGMGSLSPRILASSC
jgi:hypothetical protein